MKLEEKAKNFPDSSGVYIMRRRGGEIIYIGKALSLRRRLAYYFKAGQIRSPRLKSLMSQVETIEYLLTPSEEEALILECDLIKQHHPRYNISLRDDKKYPFLKITVNEDYPRLFITRTIKKDGARYFGPYPQVLPLRRTIRLIKKVFPIRSCRGDVTRVKRRPCLYFQINECLGPCQGKVDKDKYGQVVRQFCRFLAGGQDEIIKRLGEEMEGFSRKRQYEKAAKIRDRIKTLQKVILMTEIIAGYPPLPKKGETRQALEELKNILGLKAVPDVIQCLDVSNIQGEEAVGAVVSFQKGCPDKDNYRRFKIRIVKRIDDYAMLEEVLSRHFQNLIEAKSKLPDLLVIDGGRGHLNRALNVLGKLKVKNIPVLALAKKFECLYFSRIDKPLRLPFSSSGLSLIQRLRDEAHRFAHAYFSKLRKRKLSASVLDDVPGIGPQKKRNLLRFFGSIEMIRKAPFQDLKRVKGINEYLAGRVKESL
ncbi:MAG: excinuclease ABC subunit UvrC [Candidatus Ratteibacteria bacterium]|nr:excinuclease ABC subunit UvrC [Candidatus Ratteibacteria bacterium]